MRKEDKKFFGGLSFTILLGSPPAPPSIVLELWVMSGKLGEMIWSQRAHLGDKPGIHLFLARSWTD